MRYWHGKGGIIDITLKPELLKVWALGFTSAIQLKLDGNNETSQMSHKEEGSAQIKRDAQDRDGLRKKTSNGHQYS